MLLRNYFEYRVGCMMQALAGFLTVSVSLVCVVVGELVVFFNGHRPKLYIK